MGWQEGFYKHQALSAMQRVYGEAMPFVVRRAQSAFEGDIEAATSLAVSLENCDRGAMAVYMWRARIPKSAFRAYFAMAWDHDHHHVIRAAKTRRTLAAMFRYADFPKPAEMPERLTVWRGTSMLSQREAAQGYSWTWDRDTACWFAMRMDGFNRSPLVLRAEITKSDVALFHSGRGESEVVLLRPPAAVVCGDAHEWQLGFERFEAGKNEYQRKTPAA